MSGTTDIEHLIDMLARLPGLGPRSARRVALSLLRQPEARMLPLARHIERTARTVRTCTHCGNLDTVDPCSLCTDPSRDDSVICVVETVGDLWALERARVHRGLYQVLGGTLSAIAGLGPDDLNVEPLFTRIEQGRVQEIILALGATVEGTTTAHWLQEKLARTGVSISRVGHGVPMGGALDGLDDGTLAAALSARRLLGS